MNKLIRLLLVAQAVFNVATALPARADSFEVDNVNGDASAGSLGAAINDAGADTANSDTITFSSLFDTPQSLSLTGPYETISKSAGESLSLVAPTQLTIDTGPYSGLILIGGGNYYLGNVAIQGNGGYTNPGLFVSAGSTAFLNNVSISSAIVLNQGSLDTVTGMSTAANVYLLGTAAINVAAGQTSTFSGTISDAVGPGNTGTLVVNGPGTLVLSSDENSYSGGTQINEGTLEVAQPSSAGGVAINGTGTLALTSTSFGQNGTLTAGGGTLNLGTASRVLFSSLSRSAGGGLVIVPSGSTTLGTTQGIGMGAAPTPTNGIIDASIVAANSATDTSADFLTYNGSGLQRATYSGATNITNGVTNGTTSTSVFEATSSTNNQVTSPTTLYALKVDSGVTVEGAPITLGDGTHTAGLIINGSFEGDPTTINAGIAFATGSEGAVYVGGNGAADYAMIDGPVTGSNGLTKNGNGSLEISDAEYTGTTTVNGGTLQIDEAASPFYTSGNVINLASRLLFNGSYLGTINLTADGTLAATGLGTSGGDVLQLGGTINGNGHALTLGTSAGTGLIIVGAAQINDVSAFNVAAGTVRVSGTLDNSSVAINFGSNSAVMEIRDGATVANAINLAGGTIETAGSATLSGPVTLNNGAGPSTFNTLNAFKGGTLTVNGPLSGTGPLFTTGAGKISLTGDSHIYGGTIQNSAADLDITGNLSGSTVGAGGLTTAPGVVSGTGSVGSLLLNLDGKIHPGELGAIGTLTASSLQWTSDGTAQLQFQLSNTSNASSLLDLGSGALTKEDGGSSTFAFDFLGSGEAGQDYDLINFGAGNTNFLASDFTATDLATGLSASFEFVTNDGTESLMVDVVPEPRTDALIVAGLVMLAALVRPRGAKEPNQRLNLKLPLGLLRGAVLLHFLDDAAELVVVQDGCDGVAHLLHRDVQPARFLVRTRTRLVGGHAHARDRRQRAVEQPDHFPQRDLLRRLGQRVAALDAALALEDATVAQGEQDLLEELFGDVRALGDGGNLNQAVRPLLRFETNLDERADGVLALFGKTHAAFSTVSIDFASGVRFLRLTSPSDLAFAAALPLGSTPDFPSCAATSPLSCSGSRWPRWQASASPRPRR